MEDARSTMWIDNCISNLSNLVYNTHGSLFRLFEMDIHGRLFEHPTTNSISLLCCAVINSGKHRTKPAHAFTLKYHKKHDSGLSFLVVYSADQWPFP